jgi:hypothetical protein
MHKPIRILSASFFMLLILAYGQGARAEQQPKFTIETLPGDKRPLVSEMYALGDSIRIVEALSLPNSCDEIEGEVNFQNNFTKVFVKLKPKSKDLSTGEGCTRKDTPVFASVIISHMPFVPTCHHYITLETPQGIKKHTVTIQW